MTEPMGTLKERLQTALKKPLPKDEANIHEGVFDPWKDIIKGIDGSFCAASDRLMIGALTAVRDRATFDFIGRHGFLGEFALYVLSGHGLTQHGASPRGGWPHPDISHLWQPLIDKWTAYYARAWGKELPPSAK